MSPTPDPFRNLRDAMAPAQANAARIAAAFHNSPAQRAMREVGDHMERMSRAMEGVRRNMETATRATRALAETMAAVKSVTIAPPAAAAIAGAARLVVATTRNLRALSRAALQAVRERYRRGRHLLAALLGRTSREQAGAIARAPRVTTSREGPPGTTAPALRLVSSLVAAPGAPPAERVSPFVGMVAAA